MVGSDFWVGLAGFLSFALLAAAAASVSHRPSSSQALYFVAATAKTAVENQALPFVTATDGASLVSWRVCAMFPMGTNT